MPRDRGNGSYVGILYIFVPRNYMVSAVVYIKSVECIQIRSYILTHVDTQEVHGDISHHPIRMSRLILVWNAGTWEYKVGILNVSGQIMLRPQCDVILNNGQDLRNQWPKLFRAVIGSNSEYADILQISTMWSKQA